MCAVSAVPFLTGHQPAIEACAPQVIGWMVPQRPQDFLPDNFPVWIVQDAELATYYGERARWHVSPAVHAASSPAG